MITYIIYLTISGIICFFLAKKYAMSWGWALFFSATLSLIVAIIMILYSGSFEYSVKYKNKSTGWGNFKTVACFIVGATLMIYGCNKYSLNDHPDYNYGFWSDTDALEARNAAIKLIIVAIGFIGNGIYLISNADMGYMDKEPISMP